MYVPYIHFVTRILRIPWQSMVHILEASHAALHLRGTITNIVMLS